MQSQPYGAHQRPDRRSPLPMTVTSLVLVALVTVRAAAAPAFCGIPPVIPPSVGNTATDGNCDFDSIQDAIDAQTCPATIVITNERAYTHQHLTISNKAITLEGASGTCPGPIVSSGTPATATAAAPTSPLVTISGSNDGGGRVFTITGTSHVTLKYLTITGGTQDPTPPPGSGGGIEYFGTGALTLDTTTVTGNADDSGAGIAFYGAASPSFGDVDPVEPAVLTLGANTKIIGNTASQSGGGVQISGYARLLALDPGTTIFNNHAPNGYGGGLEVVAPAIADIGSPGFNGLAVIYGNDAKNGGGIAIIGKASANARARVRLFTTDETQPVAISGNSASEAGGGVYIQPGIDFDIINNVFVYSPAILSAYDYRIDDNIAATGAAIAGVNVSVTDPDTQTSGSLGAVINLLNSPGIVFHDDDTPENIQSLGAITCRVDVDCNTVNGNANLDVGGHPTAGSTIEFAGENASLFVLGARIQHNRGARVVDMTNASALLWGSLVTDNDVASELLAEHGATTAVSEVQESTIANNTIGGASAFYAENTIGFATSILADAKPALVLQGAGSVQAVDVLAANPSGLPPLSGTIVQGSPTFADAAHGDYHQTADSLGVDFSAAESLAYDLDRNPRSVDLPGVNNVYGPLDLGAYEIQRAYPWCDTHIDAVFCAGFDIHN